MHIGPPQPKTVAISSVLVSLQDCLLSVPLLGFSPVRMQWVKRRGVGVNLNIPNDQLCAPSKNSKASWNTLCLCSSSSRADGLDNAILMTMHTPWLNRCACGNSQAPDQDGGAFQHRREEEGAVLRAQYDELRRDNDRSADNFRPITPSF